MTVERAAVAWLEARGDYTIQELIEMSGLPPSVIEDLIACGALPAVADENTTSRDALLFEAESIVLARAAGRLREHFELEFEGLAVAVSLLRRVRVLEARLGSREEPR